MTHDIKTFLKTEIGILITCLTKLTYFKIPGGLGFKVKRHNSKISHMDVDYFEFKDFDVFVFQGTKCLFDWIADLKMALGIKPRQFKSALKFVKNNIVDGKPTYITGHSLGGAITQYVVHSLDNPNVIGVTYNGAGIRHLIKERKDKPYDIMNFYSDKDILNRLTAHLPLSYFKHIGEEHSVIDEYSKNGIQSHGNLYVFK